LAAEGAKIALSYSSNESSAQEICESLPGQGHLTIRLDVGDEESVESAFKKMLTHFSGQLHGLVNNAGITKDQLLLRMKTEDFDSVMQTNLRGTFLCTKLALKPMLKAKAGSIVNITSVIGQTGNPGQSNYAASKAGIIAFAKSVAMEVASRGIRINCIAPGFIQTAMTESLTEEQKKATMERVPLGTMGTVEDIANAVSFLLSEKAKYITGHTLNVNGGLYMS
jgi:3-oxoacyl-[acyl-carrier protein] reductase